MHENAKIIKIGSINPFLLPVEIMQIIKGISKKEKYHLPFTKKDKMQIIKQAYANTIETAFSLPKYDPSLLEKSNRINCGK